MAAKKESAKESIEKLDKAIAYKTEALRCAVDVAFTDLRNISDALKNATDELNKVISKIDGINELSESVKESINLKASYQNIKDVNGSKAKVPEVDMSTCRPEVSDNSDPIPNLNNLTVQDKLDHVINSLTALNHEQSSTDKLVNQLIESYNSLSINVRGSNLRLNRIEQALYNLSPRLKRKMKLFDEKSIDIQYRDEKPDQIVVPHVTECSGHGHGNVIEG